MDTSTTDKIVGWCFIGGLFALGFGLAFNGGMQQHTRENDLAAKHFVQYQDNHTLVLVNKLLISDNAAPDDKFWAGVDYWKAQGYTLKDTEVTGGDYRYTGNPVKVIMER